MAMNEEPEVPQTPQPLSRRLLWITLGIPPVLTLFVTGLIPLLGLQPGTSFEALIMMVFLILFGIVPGLSFHFYDAIKIRFRGSSLNFLVFSYIVGQIVGCAILSVGSCVLISFHYKIS
jgi:hypothetical protein